MADDREALLERQIAAWSGVKPPNEQGREMARQLASGGKGFEAERGRLAFEDEPASFEAALAATKDQEECR